MAWELELFMQVLLLIKYIASSPFVQCLSASRAAVEEAHHSQCPGPSVSEVDKCRSISYPYCISLHI